MSNITIVFLYVSCGQRVFQTQLFNKLKNEKGGRFFTKIVKNLPQNAWREVHFPSLGRKTALASIYFTPEKWHEKTPEALRRLGFSDRHLFRSLNVACVTDLDAFVKIHRCKLLQYHILPTGERKDWRMVLH
jgi:hypothetical protein